MGHSFDIHQWAFDGSPILFAKTSHFFIFFFQVGKAFDESSIWIFISLAVFELWLLFFAEFLKISLFWQIFESASSLWEFAYSCSEWSVWEWGVAAFGGGDSGFDFKWHNDIILSKGQIKQWK